MQNHGKAGAIIKTISSAQSELALKKDCVLTILSGSWPR